MASIAAMLDGGTTPDNPLFRPGHGNHTRFNLARLIGLVGFRRASDPAAPPPPAPYIKTGTDHYAFAAHIVAGFTIQDACKELDLNIRTTQRWRTDLCRTASEFFGRTVSYEFAARYVLDSELRAAYEAGLSTPSPIVRVS